MNTKTLVGINLLVFENQRLMKLTDKIKKLLSSSVKEDVVIGLSLLRKECKNLEEFIDVVSGAYVKNTNATLMSVPWKEFFKKNKFKKIKL